MTEKILSEYAPIFGFCPFDSIRDSLIECRAKSRIPDNAKTVIVALFPYNLGDEAYVGSDISKYAVVPDYHQVVTAKLSEAAAKLKEIYPEEEFSVFTDNSPIPEVKAAVLAGLGVKGLNGLFINPTYGSWVFIGEILTTKVYYTNKPDTQNSDLCIKCGKCITACPTNAIGDCGINADKCLSFISQKKGELTEEHQELIKNSGCAWGCDICQNICPMNQNTQINPIDEFINGAELKARTDSDIDDRAYAWRGKAVIKRNIEILNK